MTRIAAQNAGVSLGGKTVLDDVSLTVPQGSWIGVIGPNGAGKSTLLRAIAGLVAHTGDISLDGVSVASLTRRRIAQVIAFVPQNPFIPETMSVTDYVLMGRTPYISYLGRETKRDLAVVAEVLERLELGELGERSLSSLSGGELQRAVLARALAQEASLLLLDEPTSALDVGHQQQVLELVDGLRYGHDLTVLSAMHDLSLAGQFADSLVLLDGGRVVASGSARQVLTEETIRRHFGASVTIIESDGGHILVSPTRGNGARSKLEQSIESV